MNRRILSPFLLPLVTLSFLSTVTVNATLLPAPDGTVVEIIRDEFGVPHITADTEAALFFGQGYAIAQDRLVQMDQWARIGQGRWGEWLGRHYTDVSDQYWRRLLMTDQEREQVLASLPEIL